MRRRILVAAAMSLVAVVAALAIYHFGTDFVGGRFDRQPIATRAPDVGGAGSPGVFELSFLDQPRALPEIKFVNGNGDAQSLSDFRGRPVLLNIWATWCVPCRQEMSALDRLQAAFDKSQFLVLPLSIDRKGVPVVKSFYEELGIKVLDIYVDQTSNAASTLSTLGVPTTLFIDRDGREVGRKIGPAEWDSPEAIAELRERLGLPAGAQKAGP
jgi:thiol-disulfide isomerase/thioredoxin